MSAAFQSGAFQASGYTTVYRYLYGTAPTISSASALTTRGTADEPRITGSATSSTPDLDEVR